MTRFVPLTTQLNCVNFLNATLVLFGLLMANISHGQITINFDFTEPPCGGFATGSITALPSGGVGPYTYVWNTGATTQTISNIPAGLYSVTVTDALGDSGSNSMMLNEPPILNGTFTVSGCTSPGTITVTPSGGIPPYMFMWSTGETTQTITYLNPGTYCITLMDSNGCGYVNCVPVTDTPPDVVVVTTDIDCTDNNNGVAEAVVTGGTAPYTYLWSNGETTQTITGLGPGLYSVTVTDINGCTDTGSAMVNEPPPLNLQIISTDPVCVGDFNGMLQAIVSGGTMPYSYQWSTGQTTSNVFGLPPGTYSVTVTDASGCTIVDGATLNYQSEIEVNATSTDITCFGVNDGTATATAINGVPPYTYQWNNGQTGPMLTGLAPGLYFVTATDAVGCEDFDMVQILDTPPFSGMVTVTDVTECDGTDGTATAIGMGGIMPYTYEWSNGGMTQTITGLTAGLYTVTITDANGCTAVGMGVIGQPSGIEVTVVGSDEICAGDNDGNAMAIVIGGDAPFTYAWSNGANTPTVTGLAPGIYMVTVTDANNCSDVGQITIAPAAPIQVNGVIQDVDCFGENTGGIMVVASGGEAPYTYEWNTGATTAQIMNLTAGVYTVTVTDANDCTATSVFTVDEPPLLEVTIMTQGSTCTPAGVTAGATASGGVGPYSYEWNTGETTAVISNLGPGVYTVVVTDANGCTAMESITVLDDPDIQILINSTDITCVGDDDGAAMAVPQNGQAPYMYQWNNGETTATITGLSPGVYTVTVMDANGCSGTASVTINEPPLLIVNINSQDASCPGVNDGMAMAQVSGGTAPYTYQWSNGETTALITNLTPGIYTVLVTDANGCTASDEVEILQGPGLMVQVIEQDVTCAGFADGAAGAQVLNGTPPYQYEWSNGEFTQSINNLTAGVYNVNVTDALGCTGTGTAIINEPDPLEAEVNTLDATCLVSMDGIATVTSVIGGVAPYTYEWSDGQTGPTAINLNPGNYSVIITDANGCELVEFAQIDAVNDLAVTVQVTDQPCEGTMNGVAQANGTGGQGPYTYDWSNGDSGNPVFNLGAGVYQVTVTDALGCTATTTFQVVELEGPSCNAFVESEISTPGGSDGVVNVTATGGTQPYTYEWNNGVMTAQNSGLSEGIYTVTVTDANGCMTTCSVTLGDPPSAKVGDKVWNDEDQDGIQDVGEPGVEGVQVTLTGTDDDGNSISLVTTTDFAGMYLFDPVPPGTYKITFNLPNNFEWTVQNAGSNDEVDSDVDPATGMTAFFTLADGDCDLTQDAGIFQFCINVTDPGEIGFDEYLCGPGNDPAEIIELAPPTGGVGMLEYLWMMSTNPGPIGSGVWEPIPNSNTPNYDPGPIFETTYFVRCVRRDGCIQYLEPDPVVKEVGDDAIAEIEGPNIVCVDEVATFTAADAGPNATYSWDFGPNANPQFANTQSVDVTWAGFGVANIELTVENDGCTAWAYLPISITDNPIFCGNGLIIQANQIGDVIEIDWAVTGFTGNYRFMVEHSTDGLAFEDIGEMDYHETESNYTFIHDRPDYGSNFYRVLLESDQGAFIESNIVEVEMPVGLKTLSVYPNPMEETLTVEWLKNVEGPTDVSLYSITGQLLEQKQAENEDGVHEFNVSALPAGTYIIRVQHTGEGVQLFKVIKE